MTTPLETSSQASVAPQADSAHEPDADALMGTSPSLESVAARTRSCLLVIDVQNDYCHERGMLGQLGEAVEIVARMVPRLLHLIDVARQAGVMVIFTRNWHTADTESDAWRERNGSRGNRTPGMAGTWGAGFYRVQPLNDEPVISKTRYDAFLGTPLDTMLRAAGIRTVVCAGTSTNVCVDCTAKAAYMRDYNLVLVEDCCASSDTALHEATVRNIERHFGIVSRVSDLARIWRPVD